MPEYIRSRVKGGIFFFTVVTYQRMPILTNESSRRILHDAWIEVNHWFPFETIAICLLPDHLHCIWQLPEGDDNYSIRWGQIKRLFTHRYLQEIGPGQERNESHQKRREAAIWQRRFWEHTISDKVDLETHLDYIHYNPIKHGFVTKAASWEWSSFKRYVKMGIYDIDWVGGDEGRLQMMSLD
jgi:putative transposase